MSNEPIAPALSAEEWAAWRSGGVLRRETLMSPDDLAKRGQRHTALMFGYPAAGLNIAGEYSNAGLDPSFTPAVMACANAARRDDDPGKLTWEMVKTLRELDVVIERLSARFELEPELGKTSALLWIADVIAALLPPETP